MDRYAALVNFNRLAEQVLERLDLDHEDEDKNKEEAEYNRCVQEMLDAGKTSE